MKIETLKRLINTVEALANDTGVDYENIIEIENLMHSEAAEYLGVDIDDGYDPEFYLLKATTPEACQWLRLQLKERTNWYTFAMVEDGDAYSCKVQAIDSRQAYALAVATLEREIADQQGLELQEVADTLNPWVVSMVRTKDEPIQHGELS